MVTRMDDQQRFFAAVEHGDALAVEAMLAARPDLARARDATGATALHVATFAGHRAIAERLLRAGADPNARDAAHDATPAGWAIHYLRERGALLAVEIEDVRFAIERGDVAWVARFLARHPALRAAVDRDGRPLAQHPGVRADPALARLFAPAPEG
jgi:ankyrin repeat protein